MKVLSEVICPRCRNTMMLIIQSETRSNTTLVSYIYTCPVCRYRAIVEDVEIRKNGDRVYISVVKRYSNLS